MSLGSEREQAGAFLVLRNLLFYLSFYGGSIFFVLATILAMPFSVRGMQAAVWGWSNYHRVCARLLLGITVRVEGRLAEGPVLYAMRHESFYEAIDLPRFLPNPVVFAKKELLRIPLWGFAGGRYGLVPVDREQGARALRAMIAAARSFAGTGRPLAIFPEGTRVPVGSSPELQAGFAGLYKLLNLPVVPVAVDSGRLYHRRWKLPGTITYRLASPLPPGLPRTDVEARVRDAINALHD